MLYNPWMHDSLGQVPPPRGHLLKTQNPEMCEFVELGYKSQLWEKGPKDFRKKLYF